MKRIPILIVLALLLQIFIPQGVSACTPEIYVSPTYIDFGSVPVGSISSPKVVTIYNTGSGNLIINNIGILGDDPTDFMITSEHSVPKTIPKLSLYTYTLKFSPNSAGKKAAYLFIYSNDSDERVVYVELRGTGTIVCRPDISVNHTSLDFGNVPVGTQSETKAVIVSNDGNANLVIGNLTISNSRFSLVGPGDNISGQTLVPGASANISLIFTPTTSGSQTGELTIPSNDPDENPVHVNLMGNGTKPKISVDPNSVNFDNVPVGHNATRTIKVTNVGSANLTIFNVTISDGQFSLADPLTDNISGTVLAPGDSAVINLVFTPAAAGLQQGTLTITSNDLDNSPIGVPLYGNGTKPEISVEPDSVNFNNVPLGQSETKAVTVTNEGTADLTIFNLTISDGQFSLAGLSDNISGQTLAPGDSVVINLVFTPAATGLQQGTLTITSNDLEESPLDVPLYGNATVPLISVGPTPLNFGNVLVNTTSAPQSVTVTNVGTANLTIGNLTISDGQFSLAGLTDNISGQTLVPGDSANISLVFTPAATGSKTGELTIPSNDPKGDTKIELSGNGIAPKISVAPPLLDFGYVQVGSNSTARIVTVTNNGTAKLIIYTLTINDGQFTIFGDNISGDTLGLGESEVISLVFKPAATGLQSANLTITSNVPNKSPLDIPLSGIGSEGPVAPDIKVTPLSVPFGDVLVGTTSAPRDVTVSNNGTANLNIGTLTISDSQFAFADPLTDNISDQILAPDTSTTISVVFKPTAAGAQSADLTIPSDAPAHSTVTVHLTGNGTVLTTDLTITKTGNLDSIAFGDNLIYTVTVKNNGSDNATGVVVTDTLPIYVNYISANASTGNATYSSGNVTWDIGNMAADGATATATLDIVVTLKPMTTASMITNNAEVSGKEYDPDTKNNKASETTGVRSADLMITKTDSPDPIGYTGNVTWTVTVTNISSENASNVMVVDTYPSQYADIQPPTISSGSIISLPPPWLIDYTTQAGLPILTAPTGESQVLWDVGDLASGASVTMIVEAKAKFALPLPPSALNLLALMGPGLLPNFILPNSAMVLSPLADPDYGNNIAYTITGTDPEIPYADLAITKTGNPDPVIPGDNVTYTITIRNNGPENATGVFVLDGWLKSELSLQSAVPSPSTSTANTTLPQWLIDAINPGGTPPADVDFLFWNVGDLANGDNATLTITASANATLPPETTIVNFAVVSAPVLDANPTNNYAWSATSIAQTDLAIIKTDSPDPVIAGDNLTYTLTVTNNGPANATNVIVTDTLPPSATYQSDSPPAGTTTAHSSGNVTWDIGNLDAGASATLTVVVTAPPSMGVITNNARVSGNEVDLLTINNAAIADTFVVPFGNLPDITVFPMSIDFGTVVVGTPSAAQNVSVTNNGTVNLVIGSLTINNGQFAISGNNISGNTLAPNASATISVIFTPAGTGIQLASLSITSNDPDESQVNVALSGYGTTPSPPPGPPPGPPEPTPTPTPPPPPPPEPTPTPTLTPTPETLYFTVDFLGKITQEVATSDGRPVKNMAAPSPDGLHLLEIEALTGASVNETTVTLLEIREAQAPQLPENTQLVGKAYEFKPSGTVFDKPIKLTLGYNVNDLPDQVISVGAAYYTSQDGWTYLDTESTSVAELGKLTASVNHFTIFAVLAKVPPSQPSPNPALLNLSNLSITRSVHRIFEKLTYVKRTGEDAVISADVTNDGGQSGTYTAILVINGTEREREEITLEPGQTGTVSFTVIGNDKGTYTVLIGTLSGDFLSDLWINWWLIVATIVVIILIIWLIWYIIKRRKQREAPTTNQ